MSGENGDWQPSESRREGRSASPAARGGGGGGGRSRSRSPVRDRMDEDRERSDRRDNGGDRGRAPPGGGGGGGNNPGNNLHVSGLSTRCEDRDLDEIFGKFGRIQKCQVMRDPHTRDSRGFAFVTFENNDDAEAAMTGLSGTEVLGRTIHIEKAKRGRARTPTPGQYHGPPKREEFGGGGYGGGGNRPYEPRGYGRDDRRDDRRGGGGGGGDRWGGDRDSGYAIPMRSEGGSVGRDDRRGGGGGRDRYDDRRGGREERPRYDDDRRRY